MASEARWIATRSSKPSKRAESSVRWSSAASSSTTACVSWRPCGESAITRWSICVPYAASRAAATTSTRSTIPAPPPYGSSSTWAARSGVVSRYENSRRSSSVPRTVATGRCSVSHANACGTRVKTSSCTGRALRLASAPKTWCNHDLPAVEVHGDHALLDHRQQEAGVELEHVVGNARRDVRDGPEHRPALLRHLEAHELEDVVLVLAGRRERAARHFERRPA